MFEYKYGAENIVWGYSIMKKSGLKYTNMKKVEEMGILSIYLLESFVPGFQIQHPKWTICGLTSPKTPVPGVKQMYLIPRTGWGWGSRAPGFSGQASPILSLP